ncbi:thiamine phosphate synthase [Desulfoplanes formicivorans]|uniref:Thiamine-phosphate synthase n=1 Tax=Desulfoplanes formicivorans TaxID=1592317 RepID=A0A194AIQ5_9BACT|nr:thiamine phosphate synthase [Desulfoplanes formicivorans]GAU09208.1 thiamine-phosphate pyrophosphorylase [Desulfoplanes formicivorans]
MKPAHVDYRVYLVTDRPLCLGRDLLDIVRQAVHAGVGLVQLREKQASTRAFVELGRSVRAITSKASIPLLINDRIDVALAVGADGVHIGQSDMPFADARKILGPDKIVGLSIDTWEQLLQANQLDLDYLGIGPVFPTTTKTDTSGEWGIAGITRARAASVHTLVGIGGITKDNAGQVIGAGAHGIAVVSAICSAPSPARAVKDLRTAVEQGRRSYQTRL